MHAVAGKGMSGVMVARMMRSISSGFTPAFCMARVAAWAARSEVYSSLAATRRARIPVRLAIHSSVVSTIFSRSALVTTRVGT